MNNKVFTVGNEKNYDQGIIKYGPDFKKLGLGKDYPGGFACRNPYDAKMLIEEFGKQGEWAIYELEANWYEDTQPSQNGWWNSLIRDSVIIRKVII